MQITRHLVHFGLQLAIEMHVLVQTAHTSTVLQCMVHLVDFCMVISAPSFSISCKESLLGLLHSVFCLIERSQKSLAKHVGNEA